MIRYYLYIVLFSLFPVLLKAQSTVKVLSLPDSLPVSGVNFLEVGSTSGFVSNHAGIVVIPENKLNHTFVVSHIAFKSQTITLTEKVKIVYLSQTELNLSEAVVVESVSERILKRVIARLDSNFIVQPYRQNFYYRQLHRENGQRVREFYADVNLLQNGLHNDGINFKHRVKVLALKKVTDKEANKEEHGDHLIDLIMENPVYYPTASVLSINALPFYDLEIITDSDTTLTIQFKEKQMHQDYLRSGVIVVEKGGMGIFRYEENVVRNPKRTKKRDYLITGLNWILKEKHKNFVYAKSGNKFYLQRADFWYYHHLLNGTTYNVDYKLTEQFTLHAYQIPVIIADPVLSAFDKSSNLYLTKDFGEVNIKFWDNVIGYSIPDNLK